MLQLNRNIFTDDQEDVEKRRNEVVSVLVENVKDNSQQQKYHNLNVGEKVQFGKRVLLVVLPIFLPLFVASHIDLVQHVIERYRRGTVQVNFTLKTCAIEIAPKNETLVCA